MRASAVAAVAVLGACGDDPPPPEPKSTPAYAKTPADVLPDEPLPDLRYVDVTREAGIDFVHETGAYGEKLMPETMGAGCAFLDHDGDGDQDLLLLNGDWWPGHEKEGARPTWRFFRNDGGFRFTDATDDVGLNVSAYGMGVAAADTDGDGDSDLFVTCVGGYRFFRNDGGRFVDVTGQAGLDPGTWRDAEGREHGAFATSAAFLDYDRDGYVDLFVAHYVRWSQETDVWSTMDGTNKTYAIPTVYQGESCRLWRNLGGNRFEDATDRAGVRNDEGKSLGVLVLDVDEDGWPDIVVANDTQPNYLYRNRGDGTFEERGRQAGIAYDRNVRARAGMGVDGAYLGAEPRLVFAIGNFAGEPVSLWDRRGSAFVDRADVCGIALVTQPSLTIGQRIFDADLDGRADIALANGHIEPTVQSVHQDVAYEQPSQLLRAVGQDCFADVTANVGEDFGRPRVARSIATADVDGDGDLDLCITVNGGAPVLLRGDLANASSRSLRVDVRGAAPATDALGARVTVEVGGRKQVQWVRTGGGYLGQSETTLTFGLGDAGRADRVTVRWPDGTERTFESVPAGSLPVAP